jgi:hypothetical protein
MKTKDALQGLKELSALDTGQKVLEISWVNFLKN